LPGLADSFVGCEASERLQSAPGIVGSDEVVEVLPKLVVIVIVVALDRSVLDSAVHPLDLAVGPGVLRFGEPVFNVVLGAGEFE